MEVHTAKLYPPAATIENVAESVILSLDLSTKTGFSIFKGDIPLVFGVRHTVVPGLAPKDHPEKQPGYPQNLIKGASDAAKEVEKLLDEYRPDVVVIENTVLGRNRGSQRLLEWIHLRVVELLNKRGIPFHYMDPSEWRKILEMRLTNEDKKNNQAVSKGKKRGRIGKKHLSVRWANQTFGLKLKLKDNDCADALALGVAFLRKKYGSVF